MCVFAGACCLRLVVMVCLFVVVDLDTVVNFWLCWFCLICLCIGFVSWFWVAACLCYFVVGFAYAGVSVGGV